MIVKTFKSIGYALNGIISAFSQRNIRIALIASIIVVLMGVYFEIDKTEWLLIVLIVGNIFTAEIFNSSIEDLSDNEKKLGLPYEDAGTARDLAAGAVLIQVFVSIAIGAVIFLPKIVEKFF